MMIWDDSLAATGTDSAARQAARDLERVLTAHSDLREIFDGFTRCLETIYDISRGFLAVREGGQTRFMAVASWQQGQVRKNLSLRLPTESSLLERVAEDGQVYADTFAELCDGNRIERRLLLGDNARSFVLRPLKHDAQVVGMLGYSSDNPDAFAAFDENLWDPYLNRFAERIADYQAAPAHHMD